MRLPADAICAPDGSDRLALHVGHTMQVHFNRPTRLVCGKDKKVDDGCVPLVVSNRVNYGLGYFRILSREEPDHHAELARVEAEHAWVTGSALVVCISPELRGIVRHKQHQIIKQLCTPDTEEARAPEGYPGLYGRPLWECDA